ncbi:hypothetical protein [Yoonia sp. BS5-3]|uniref:Uncharacterized protein n=1 Tax=Yoonia phaeophyticola TaxID=3137369 RepID=A0ABZ2V141_9RHOB
MTNMGRVIKDLWQHNRLALLAFGIALCAFGFFGIKTASHVIYWADPAHQDQPLAAWMTPRYVGQSHQVPPEVVKEAFFLAADGPPRRISIGTIAAEQDMTIAQLQERLDGIVAAWRAANPGRGG